MWIQVKSMDGKVSARIDGLSKLTKIEDLREVLIDKFDAPPHLQRLFYRGKQLEDGHTLFDYSVGLNDIVQILIRQSVAAVTKNTPSPVKKADKENKSETPTKNADKSWSSKYFKINDFVDAKDPTHGAWFEAKIVDIKPRNFCEENVLQSISKNIFEKQEGNLLENNKLYDDLLYCVAFEDYEDSVDVKLRCVRPRARKCVKFQDLKVGDFVMINYNIEEPKNRGFWYDCKVTDLKNGRTQKKIIGTIIMGANSYLENCVITLTEEVFAIEKIVKLSEKTGDAVEESISRNKMANCSHCKDNPARKCKECSCHVCGGKDAPEKQIMCDECNYPYHLWCLTPPLTEVPEEDDWYCPDCKNDETEVVRAGEKLKESKKKSKMPSANTSSSRDWGKGMACQGRTKECTIVPPNHFGPIPGVEVGTMWKFRVQVSESGVHRPPVSGIHGRESEGAYSIVLSGGYEDDLDEGEEFKYTGSGGRDLSGNKRCAEQSCDQTLTRMNKALAMNCNAAVNSKGSEGKDWTAGKPVRVVRNCKGRKHSEYAPEEGNRYDGIYKVVKYWPEKGKSGFLVWRYFLRRDDPNPAPWTKAGRKKIKELGLTMQYPDGYLESQNNKEKDLDEEEVKKKRKKSENSTSEPTKKRKSVYAIPSEAQKHIEKDASNKKLWEDCLAVIEEGSQAFLKKVEDAFSCICCQEVVFQPITTVCFHNICKSCLSRSFKAEVFSCPMCRQELEKNVINKTNDFLQKALLALFPGYSVGR